MRAVSFVSLALALVAATPAAAVDYSVPSTWRKPTTSRTLDQRKTIANNAMNKMVAWKGSNSNQNVGGLGYWPSANAWSSIVLKDLDAGTKDFIGKTLDAVGDTYGQHPAFRANEYNDDTLWWAHAAVYQYLAYGDTVALGWAKDSWANVGAYQVTSTSGNGKNFNWPSTCNGKSTAGGVFWTSRADDAYVNSITTDLFFALSAYLYQITKEAKYLNAANAARQYTKNFLVASDGLITDGLTISTCAINGAKWTYNSGKYVEGLAVLYTATGTQSYMDDAINTAVAGMKTSIWTGSDGIITDGQGTPYNQNNDGRNFKGIMLRGYAELYRRASNNSALRTLIRSYINVQANALIDLASDNASNPSQYGVNWHGPMDAGYSHGQLAALDALAAFVLVN